MKYKYKRKPYRHQVAALKKLLSTGFGGALLMEPRTGKTQVVIDFASIMHQAGKVNRVLIICPISVIGVWEDEIAEVCPFKYRITIWDKEGRKETELPRYGRDVLDFVVMNIDALSTPGAIRGRDENGNILRSKSRGGRYTVKKKLKAWGPQLIALDESHRIASPSAKRSTAAHTLSSLAEYRIIATGTVVTKKRKVFSIYSQWKFLNPGGWIRKYTFAEFKDRFGKWTRRNGYDQWRGNNEYEVAKLKLKMHKDAFAVTRAECFDLPKARDQIVPVELTGKNAQIYDEMVENMIAEIRAGEMTEAQIKLVLRLRLSQLTSGIARTAPSDEYLEGRSVRVGRDKLVVLENLLADLYEAEEKVVLAARFRADLASIIAVHKKLKIPTHHLYGGMKRGERDAEIKGFRKYDGPMGFVMQPASGSLGIDLSSAATMIWYSLIDSYVDYTQAKDRIALTPHGAVHMHLLCKGTIDYEMYHDLQEDDDFVKRIHQSPERLRRNFRR